MHNNPLIWLHFYFNYQLFIPTSSWDPESRISVLQICQKMDDCGMALPQRTYNLYLRPVFGTQISQRWYGEKRDKYPERY